MEFFPHHPRDLGMVKRRGDPKPQFLLMASLPQYANLIATH